MLILDVMSRQGLEVKLKGGGGGEEVDVMLGAFLTETDCRRGDCKLTHVVREAGPIASEKHTTPHHASSFHL